MTHVAPNISDDMLNPAPVLQPQHYQQPHPQHHPHDSGLSVSSAVPGADGSDSKQDNAAIIRNLEGENHALAERLNADSQRFADYENEIRTLQAKLRQEQRKNSAAAAATSPSADPSPSQSEKPQLSRFGSFIGSRRPSPSHALAVGTTTSVPSTAANAAREKELEAQVVREQTARIAAEKKVKEVNAEIEDLSATLFQQANEMVAAERKENARLQEELHVAQARGEGLQTRWEEAQAAHGDQRQQDREGILAEIEKLRERNTMLEARDAERRKRLDRLEAANKRIERVRTMLMPP